MEENDKGILENANMFPMLTRRKLFFFAAISENNWILLANNRKIIEKIDVYSLTRLQIPGV